MAIYHFSGQTIGRSSGRSSVASAAYRAGEKLFDARTGEIKDYERKGGVVHSEILMPENAPPEFADRNTLWNAVEAAENRKDAQLARDINVAIPNELTKEQGIRLVRNFVTEQMVMLGMIADVNHHEAHEKKHENNHGHIMLTMRDVNEEGFGKKNRDWNDKALMQKWREEWANYANKALEEAGHDARIDHRSLKDQGSDLEPTIHMGPAVTAMEEKGIKTIVGDINRDIEKRNADIIELGKTHEEIQKVHDDRALEKSYEGETAGEKAGFVKTLDLAFVKDAESGQFIWKNQFEDNGKKIVAFVEHVDKITAHSQNQTAIKAMAQASIEKFGNDFNVKGNEKFRREMWLQGSMLGAKVSGFEPSQNDLSELSKRAADHKEKYGTELKLHSSVEERMLLNTVNEKNFQKIAVNDRFNSDFEENKGIDSIKPAEPLKPKTKDQDNDRNNAPERSKNAGFEKRRLVTDRKRQAPENRLRTLSELGMDAIKGQRNKGVLPGYERLNIQQRREEPAPVVRRDADHELKPTTPQKAPEVPAAKPAVSSVTDGLSKFRNKQPKSIISVTSDLTEAQKEIERIRKEQTDKINNDRNLKSDLTALIGAKAMMEDDTKTHRNKAYTDVISIKDRKERKVAHEAYKELHNRYENSNWAMKIAQKKDLKKAEERRDQIEDKIKRKLPDINELAAEYKQNEASRMRAKIEEAREKVKLSEAEDERLKEALKQQQEKLNAARNDLEKLDPDNYKQTMIKLGYETETDGGER